MARTRSALVPDPATILLEFSLAPVKPLSAARIRTRQTYRVIRTTQVDPKDPPFSPGDVAAMAARPPGDGFQGTSRKAAKLSLASATMEEFADLKDLLDALPSVATMRAIRPRISTDATSNRVDHEKRAVRIRARLYAASRESDNDFHLIIGREPTQLRRFMTVEISGLPPASSAFRSTLEAARNTFKDFFSPHPLGLPGTSYDFYVPPIPVEIEGSLFFDMNHATGSRPGPQDLRPDMPTIWEIHPVSKITFEP
jgi:hypothetical protein